MSIIFVGSTVDRETLKNLPDASVAGNKMELGFVKGFIENGVHTVALSVEAHGMWKFNRKPIIVKKKHLKDEAAEIETIPYINLPLVKQIAIMYNLKKRLKKMIKTDEYKNATLFVYNTMTIFASPALSVSKKNSLTSIGVIADLPIKFKKSIIRRIEDKRQQNAIKEFTALIPLTKYIAQDFAPGVPYCVVEAGCNPQDYDEDLKTRQKSNKKNIVFSGTLNELSGIELIINAMSHIQDMNISLHIYGDGPLKQLALNAESTSNNIFYHGQVPNDKMMEIQKNADLLVCPRKPDDFTTKYTFPSKILEYICSGVPVLSNRLTGIPEEYEDYINFAASESDLDWANAIVEIFNDNNYDKYIKKALSARRIILQKKSWSNQTMTALKCFENEGLYIK